MSFDKKSNTEGMLIVLVNSWNCCHVTSKSWGKYFDPHHQGSSVLTRLWNGDTGSRRVAQICPTTRAENSTSLQYYELSFDASVGLECGIVYRPYPVLGNAYVINFSFLKIVSVCNISDADNLVSCLDSERKTLNKQECILIPKRVRKNERFTYIFIITSTCSSMQI